MNSSMSLSIKPLSLSARSAMGTDALGPKLRTGTVKQLASLLQGYGQPPARVDKPAARLKVSPEVRPEEEITVCFNIEGKGKKSDFLGLYESNHFAADEYDASLMTYGHRKASKIFIAPRKEGTYTIRLVRDDTSILATGTVVVARRTARKSVSPVSVMEMADSVNLSS